MTLEEAQIGDYTTVLRVTLQAPRARPVVMVLWKSIYTTINLHNITGMEREVIVAATTLKVVPSPGGLKLLCTTATRVFVNPGLQIAKDMAREFRVERNGAPVERLAIRTMYEPYPNASTPATDIASFYHEHQSVLRLAATITAISEREPWFSGSCMACISKVHQRGMVFSCEEHGDMYVAYSYKAACTVTDHTGTTIVTVLDKGILDMIGVRGYEMINVKEYEDTHVLSHPIRALMGTRWAFMVKMGKRNGGHLRFVSNDVRPITVASLSELPN